LKFRKLVLGEVREYQVPEVGGRVEEAAEEKTVVSLILH